MKDISVVIVNWNTRQLLLKSIESLLKETKKYSMEIIVVDNASSDDSVVELNKKYKNKIKLIQNDANLGFAKANNIGIKQSNARYICMINTDTVALENVLDKMTAYMDAKPEIGALLCDHLDKNLKRSITLRELPTLRNIFCEAFYLNKFFPDINLFRGRELSLKEYEKIIQVGSVPCNYMLIRRETIDKVGLLDELFFIYAEDIDFSKRINDAGWQVVYTPHAKAIHYGGSSSSVARGKFLIERITAELQYWKKHHGAFKQFIYRMILIIHYLLRTAGYILGFPITILSGKKNRYYRKRIASYSASLFYLLTGLGPRIKRT